VRVTAAHGFLLRRGRVIGRDSFSRFDPNDPGVQRAPLEDSGESRAAFLKHVAIAGGGIAGAGLLAAGLPRLAASQTSSEQDVEILNFLLLVEQLQEAFYSAAVSGGAIGGELLGFARVVVEHERAHVAALTQALGDEARTAPKFDFGDTTSETGQFARTALEIEEAATAAYIGQGANLTNRGVKTIVRIAAVEARHTAWIRDFAGLNPAPRPADPAKSADEVTAMFRSRGFLGG